MALQAGAGHVVAQPLFLRPMARRHLFAWLEREFPHLAPIYRHLYARRDYLGEEAQDRLLTTFRRLRLAAGFPLRPMLISSPVSTRLSKPDK